MKTLLISMSILFILISEIYSQELYRPSYTFLYNKTIGINYEEAGIGDTTLIFLHGFGLSLYTWNDIRNAFPIDKYKMYFIDFKGFGFSSKDRNSDYTFAEQANIIKSFITDKQIKNVILIGHSYGGGVSLNLEVMNIKDSLNLDIIKLVLLDPGCYMENVPFFIKYLRNPVLNLFTLRLTPVKVGVNVILKKTFYDPNKITEKLKTRYLYSQKVDNYKYSVTLSAKQIVPKNYSELIEAYQKITIPTLLIWGNNDYIIPLENGVRLNKAIKSSVLVPIEKCGHVPQEEWPILTERLILDFIKGDF